MAKPISSLYLKLLILMFVVAMLLGKAKYASKAEALKTLKNKKGGLSFFPKFLENIWKYVGPCLINASTGILKKQV